MSQCTPTPSSARVFITRTFYSVSVYSYCLFCSSIHILYLLFCLSVLPLPLLLEYLCLVRFIPSQCSSIASFARVFMSCTFHHVSVLFHYLFCSSSYVSFILSCLSVFPLALFLEYLCLVCSILSQCIPSASSAQVFMSRLFYPVSVYSHCIFCSSIYVLYVLSCLSVFLGPLLLQSLCLVCPILSQCIPTASSARVFMSRLFYPVSVYSHCLFCSSIYVLYVLSCLSVFLAPLLLESTCFVYFIPFQCVPTVSSTRVCMSRLFYPV